MPRQRKPRDPFQISLSDKEMKDLAILLSTEIQGAIDARDTIIGDGMMIDQWHKLYEGGDKRLSKDTPWKGAANLTSWIGTEKVDSLRARTVQALFSDPIWVVEGWGEASARVPQVELFHQWKAEETRLQTILTKVIHNALIEGTGVLEVGEKPVPRKIRERVQVRFQTRPDGQVIRDMVTNKPVPMLDPTTGSPVPPDAQTPPDAVGLMVRDRIGKVRSGPQYRVIGLRDYVHLPGHAQEKSDIWGYAKRFWKRVPELKSLENLGVYADVDELGDEGEREPLTMHLREGQHIADQKGPTAEKELWEILFLNDLDGDGIEEWYVATLHLKKQKIIRLQYDDLGQSRYILWTPFPRPNFVYGYSLIGHKLETIIAEHTAWRNMIADRAHLAVNAPMKRVFGSIWNPKKEPWRPGGVLTVRDHRDLEPLTVTDVPRSAIEREGTVLSASERVSGLVDQNSGVNPMEERTLGEVRYVGAQGMVRIQEIVHHLHESMEDLFNINHEIWKRTLRENPEPFPSGLQAALEVKGMTLPDGAMNASMLEGVFRGKPNGSVESADPTRMKRDLAEFMTAMTQMAQAVPTMGMILNDPEVTKAILNQSMRVYRWEMRGAIERAFDKVQMMQRMRSQMGFPPGQAGPPRPPQEGPPSEPQQER